MKKSPLILAALAGATLVAVFLAAKNLPNTSAALPLAATGQKQQDSTPRITGASTTPVSINQGLLKLSVTGENVERYRVSATCPGKVSIQISGTDVCSSAKNRTPDELEKQILSLSNPENATGTAVIRVQIDKPEVPMAPWTNRTLSVEVLAE